MTVHDPGPWFVRIRYHSEFSPHQHQLSINTWNDVPSTGDAGKVDDWVGGSIDLVDMVTALVDKLLPFYKNTVTYDSWTLYNVPTVGAAPQPIQGDTLTAKVGTNATPGWYKAIGTTLSMRTTLFHDAKLVMLDSGSGDVYGKISTPAAGKQQDLFDELSADTNGWAGRDNAQMTQFVSYVIDLNDKLQKTYRMQ